MVKKGSKVKVVRGRKVPVGTTGYVIWSGQTQYGERLGIKRDPENQDEEPSWTAASNVEVIEEGSGPERQDVEQDVAHGKDRVLEAARREIAELTARLHAEVAAHAETKKLLDSIRDSANGDRDRLGKAYDKARAEVDDWKARAETLAKRDHAEAALKAALAPAPRLDDRTLAQVVAFGASQAEKALLVALRQKLGREPAPAAPDRSGATRAPVDLDAAPGELCSSCGKALLDSDLVQCSKCGTPRQVLKVAPISPAGVDAALAELDAKAPEVHVPKRVSATPATPPEYRDAPTSSPVASPAPVGKLGKCSKCQRFHLNTSPCKK